MYYKFPEPVSLFHPSYIWDQYKIVICVELEANDTCKKTSVLVLD